MVSAIGINCLYRAILQAGLLVVVGQEDKIYPWQIMEVQSWVREPFGGDLCGTQRS